LKEKEKYYFFWLIHSDNCTWCSISNQVHYPVYCSSFHSTGVQTIRSRQPNLKSLNISRAVIIKRKKTLGKFSEKEKGIITSAKGQQ